MSSRLLLRWGLRHHLHQPLRSGLAVLGVALGVALLVGIQASLGSATGSFAAAARAAAGGATHVVRGGADGVPTAALAVLEGDPAVRACAPVIEGRAECGDGAAGVRFYGCDPLAEAAVGRPLAPESAAAGAAAELMVGSGAFAATAATLARIDADADGRVTVVPVGGRPWPARCVRTIAAGERGDALTGRIVVDIATAQEWRGQPTAVDRIDVVLDERDAAAAARLEALLAPAAHIEPLAAQAGFADLTAAFRTDLQALGLMALLVGAFLVHAAMRGAVAGRQSEFALLRALGAPALRVGAAVLREALVLGLGGSLLGCGLGIGAAHVLVGPLVRTLNDHYAHFAVRGVTVAPVLLAAAIAVGTLVAAAAALAQEFEAAHAPPRAVFVSSRLPHAPKQWPLWPLWPAALAGVALLFGAGHRVALAHAGLLVLLLVVAAVTPRLIGRALAAAGRWSPRFGPWVAYLVRSAAASRSRTGSATAALVLAVAMTVGLGTMIESFRASVTAWLDQALPADVYVGVSVRNEEQDASVVPPEIEAALASAPGVAAVTRYRRCRLDVGVRGEPAVPVDTLVLTPSPRSLQLLPLLDANADARERFAAGAGALASEPLAFRLGLAVGDAVTVATAGGRRALPIVGIVRDYRSARGELTLPAAWYGPVASNSLGLEAAPGVTAAALERQVAASLGAAARQYFIDSQAGIRVATLRVFDRTFAITVAMRLLCLGIAVLGIYGAFAALQLERLAEIGLLRTLGAGPRQVALLVLGQTTLLGLLAGVLALPVGYGLGQALVHAINRGSFGWTLQGVRLPPQVASEALLLAVVAAFAAGIAPAWRMARASPAAALREG